MHAIVLIRGPRGVSAPQLVQHGAEPTKVRVARLVARKSVRAYGFRLFNIAVMFITPSACLSTEGTIKYARGSRFAVRYILQLSLSVSLS